uniref:ATP synthase F0 subunit 8 n=1 Tax=Bemisia afer TaxID=166114 RepID=A0A023IZ76_BEMAF|nr:ATP synthase F0 subunit 8 [Bemisia afer]AHC02240.1 ATP synthase F0 subunit 8 [Bemisia afer]
MSPLGWSYLMLVFWVCWLMFSVFLFFWMRVGSSLTSFFFFFFFYYNPLKFKSCSMCFSMFSQVLMFKVSF